MKQPKPVTIDFETEAIERRPAYPPKPVGVSIKYWGQPARYYGFGHPTGNNCTELEAAQALAAVWQHPDGLLFQNGKFDVDVAETHWHAERRDWHAYHDTMFLLFLDDPHATTFSLKPSAQRVLGWAPEEQDAVRDWLIAHQPVPGVRIGKGNFGAYIAYAPGDVVGRYANGDVDRTEALFRRLWKSVTQDRAMADAYDRERRLMPHLLDLERHGIPVAHARLRADAERYGAWLGRVDAWIMKRVKAGPGFNVDSDAELVAALLAANLADKALLGRTEKGAIQANKEALERGVTDRQLYAVLKYRGALATCLRTFMLPWLVMADASGGRIFTNWNQVKGGDGRDQAGAKTGRLSSNPNFQNIPKPFAELWRHERTMATLAAEVAKLVRCPWRDLPPLPQVRSYLVPFPGDILIDRDYSQQELRAMAHFEDGALAAAYHADPWLDVHDYARDLINGLLGTSFSRKPIKNTGFGLIYGMGLGKLAIKNGTDVTMAKRVKDAYLATFPGLKAMYAEMKRRAKAGEPIRTWGGREYYCEPPAIMKSGPRAGRIAEFDYKLVNVLIQGSSADATKEGVIRYCDAKPAHHRLLLQVHDQATASVPRKELRDGMELMRAALESVEFDVPMLSEGAWSATSWADLQPYDEKGKILYTGK